MSPLGSGTKQFSPTQYLLHLLIYIYTAFGTIFALAYIRILPLVEAWLMFCFLEREVLFTPGILPGSELIPLYSSSPSLF